MSVEIVYESDNKLAHADACQVYELLQEKKFTQEELEYLNLDEFEFADVEPDDFTTDDRYDVLFFNLTEEITENNRKNLELFVSCMSKICSFFDRYIDSDECNLDLQKVKSLHEEYKNDSRLEFEAASNDDEHYRIYFRDSDDDINFLFEIASKLQ